MPGKARFDALAVTAPFGADYPLLLRAVGAGDHYNRAVLTERDAAGHPVAAWVLDTVFVSGDKIDNDSAAVPSESLKFAFGSVTEATSDRTTSWSQVDNKAGGTDLPAGLDLSPLPAGPAQPPRDRRHQPLSPGRAQHVVAHAVQLEEDGAGGGGAGGAASSAAVGEPVEPAPVGVVVAHGQGGAGGGGDGGHHGGDDHGRLRCRLGAA